MLQAFSPVLSSLTTHAGDFGRLPLAAGAAADGWGVSLDEALFAVIADQGVDLIAGLLCAKHFGVLHQRRLAAGHWMVRNREQLERRTRSVISNGQCSYS